MLQDNISRLVKIVAIEKQSLYVEPVQSSLCRTCQSSQMGCGLRFFQFKKTRYRIPLNHLSHHNYQMGDCLSVRTTKQHILMSALGLYCVPLLFFLSSILFFHYLGFSEAVIIWAGMIGLGMGLWSMTLFSKCYDKKMMTQFKLLEPHTELEK